jgi:hypothetical protein
VRSIGFYGAEKAGEKPAQFLFCSKQNIPFSGLSQAAKLHEDEQAVGAKGGVALNLTTAFPLQEMSRNLLHPPLAREGAASGISCMSNGAPTMRNTARISQHPKPEHRATDKPVSARRPAKTGGGESAEMLDPPFIAATAPCQGG